MTESKVETPYVVVIDSRPPPLSTPPPLPPARKEPKNKEKRSPTQIIVLSSIIGILVVSLCVFVALYTSENEKCNDESQRQTSDIDEYIQNMYFKDAMFRCERNNSRKGINCIDVDECRSNPCHQNFKCVNSIGSYTCQSLKGFSANKRNSSHEGTKDCADLYKTGIRGNGVYTINPDGLEAFQVSCDMTTAGGGWTVFQRRMDGSVNFYRGWKAYKDGFGSLNGEFWLGLDKINRLSDSGQNILRVDLEDFENQTYYAEYNTFAVSDEKAKYELTVKGYSGNAGDSLITHNKMEFSTKDADNDRATNNCAVLFKGAWWYNNCHDSNLNGLYHSRPHVSGDSVVWFYWKKSNYSFKKAEMKIRPRQFY